MIEPTSSKSLVSIFSRVKSIRYSSSNYRWQRLVTQVLSFTLLICGKSHPDDNVYITINNLDLWFLDLWSWFFFLVIIFITCSFKSIIKNVSKKILKYFQNLKLVNFQVYNLKLFQINSTYYTVKQTKNTTPKHQRLCRRCISYNKEKYEP